MTRTRLQPEERRAAILAAAMRLAREQGYTNVRRDAVAVEADVSAGLVTTYFSTMAKLRRAIMRAAVAQGVVEIVAQGLAAGDKHAQGADEALKRKAGEYLINR